uniref:Defensin-like protein n=1 Tax=Panagrolaimus sp. PS1159 TaxID=55785 RepID=A0AC35G2M9_9BILA
MANLCRINTPKLKCALKSVNGLTNFAIIFIIIFFCCIITTTESSTCHAKCSPHFTLPCSFGAFDKCIENTCKEACQKDGSRKMIACYCRGTIEGPTMRACFCSPSPNHKPMVLI